jgi:activating signal cointegrator 1
MTRLIPVLSLWEPWATAVARGIKTVETRSWAPPPALHGQPIGIHAAKTQRPWLELTNEARFDRSGPEAKLVEDLKHAGVDVLELAFGCIVATAVVAAVFVTDTVLESQAETMWSRDGGRLAVSARDRRWGDYSPARFAWALTDVRPLATPMCFTGGQALTRKVAADAVGR